MSTYIITTGTGTGAVRKGVIVVDYPEGADCTLANPDRSYAALDTSGKAAFVVAPGEWEVSVTDGERSEKRMVTVAAQEFTAVNISFWDGVLYDRGDGRADITGGWGAYDFRVAETTFSGAIINNGEGSITLTVQGNGGAASHSTALDISDYSSLRVHLTSNDFPTGRLHLFLSRNHLDSAAALQIAGEAVGNQVLRFDVSALSGKYYAGLGGYAAYGVSYTAVFDKMWFV